MKARSFSRFCGEGSVGAQMADECFSIEATRLSMVKGMIGMSFFLSSDVKFVFANVVGGGRLDIFHTPASKVAQEKRFSESPERFLDDASKRSSRRCLTSSDGFSVVSERANIAFFFVVLAGEDGCLDVVVCERDWRAELEFAFEGCGVMVEFLLALLRCSA